MKKRLTAVIVLLIFLAGASLMLYPAASNYWNVKNQTRAITQYADAAAGLDEAASAEILSDAHAYNSRLFAAGRRSINLPAKYRQEYEEQLNISGTGIMGYVEVPEINCRLPIYHGTDDGVLQVAVGHIEGSSLPVGGESTHCVLLGHRGLPTERLFTDLDKMKEGDLIFLYVLDQVLTYEVEEILVVLPEEVEPLFIRKGEDLCTLVTCTPYGVNTHRILVRGRRVENPADVQTGVITEEVTATRLPLAVPAAALALVAALVIAGVWMRKRKEKQRF